MADSGVPTLAPQPHAPNVSTPVIKPLVSPINTDRETIFDSIAQRDEELEGSSSSSLGTYFTGLLWFGYAIAIVVALALVWSAAKELLH